MSILLIKFCCCLISNVWCVWWQVEETLAVVCSPLSLPSSGLCYHTHSPAVHLGSGNKRSQGRAVPEGSGAVPEGSGEDMVRHAALFSWSWGFYLPSLVPSSWPPARHGARRRVHPRHYGQSSSSGTHSLNMHAKVIKAIARWPKAFSEHLLVCSWRQFIQVLEMSP